MATRPYIEKSASVDVEVGVTITADDIDAEIVADWLGRVATNEQRADAIGRTYSDTAGIKIETLHDVQKFEILAELFERCTWDELVKIQSQIIGEMKLKQ